MSFSSKVRINRLIEELKVNDREEVYEGKEREVEPKEAIDALIKIGKPAVPHLLKLLGEYRHEEIARYYADYAVRILGEIRDTRSIDLLIELLIITWDDYAPSEAVEALKKIGLSTIKGVSIVPKNLEDDPAWKAIHNQRPWKRSPTHNPPPNQSESERRNYSHPQTTSIEGKVHIFLLPNTSNVHSRF